MRSTWRPLTILAAGLFLISTSAFAQTSAGGQVTFTKDVAPILQKACQDCHRPGMMAPMSLLTYQDARPWARSIKTKVATREMPPWFIDQARRHPEVQERSVALRQGDRDDREVGRLPARRRAIRPTCRSRVDFDAMATWHIKPDLVVKMPKPYMLKAHGRDEFVDVTIDPGFKEDMYVIGDRDAADRDGRLQGHSPRDLERDRGRETIRPASS